MTKKLISLVIILSMMLTLTACKNNADNEEALLDVNTPKTEADNSSSENAPSNSTQDTAAGQNTPTATDDKAVAESVTGTSGDPYTIYDGNWTIQGEIMNDNGFTPDDRSQYGKITENVFVKTEEENTSTFAADIDTASYAIVRRYLANGYNIPADAVRIEEMINYFNYDYGTPKNNEPFSVVTESFDCPWSDSKLVRIGLATAEPDYTKMPASNLVFLIDVSGSMDTPNKLPLVKQAFSMLTENLKATDKVSIVTYASSDKVVIEGFGADKQMEIQNAIENLTAGGGTYGSQGIITAYQLAEKYFIKGGNNRVILATDGDLNIGITNTDELTKLITDKKQSGIYLSVMGFGTDNLMDDKLEAIADNGNGNYSYIDSSLEARKVLIEEMGGTLFTVAKDVKLQVEFNKDAISEYRLVGYENRVMANEDFDDDSKDGGEIGAGHRMTVIYEVKSKDIENEKWLDLSIRYKAPDEDTSKLLTYSVGKDNYTNAPSEDSLFTASVAQFGMLLRKSENTTGDYANVLTRIENLECVKNDVYKKEFLGFVKKLAGE